MKKTLYIHIGHFKTGTTALQIFFSQNQKYLNSLGIEFATSHGHLSKHSALAFCIYKEAEVSALMHGYGDPEPPLEKWEHFLNYVRGNSQKTTLISSEEFIRVGEFPKAGEILKKIVDRNRDVEIKAVVYLRSPQTHLRSWYNQLIKMRIETPDFSSALHSTIESIHYDYDKALLPWINALGAENIIVREYFGAAKDSFFLIKDFMSCLGAEVPKSLLGAVGDPNPRMDDRVIEIIRMMQNTGIARKSVEAIKRRVAAYIECQDNLVSDDPVDTELVQRQSLSGLKNLARLPRCNIDIDRFRAEISDPQSPETRELNLALGFAFSEIISLRQRLNRLEAIEVEERLVSLEQIQKSPGGEQ